MAHESGVVSKDIGGQLRLFHCINIIGKNILKYHRDNDHSFLSVIIKIYTRWSTK